VSFGGGVLMKIKRKKFASKVHLLGSK